MLRAFFLIKIQSIKSALQYPGNFLLDVVGISLNGFVEVLVILLLTNTFHAIGGWDFWQVGFMAGLWRLSHSLHQALFLGFWEHHWLVRDGEYDTILVRPAHPIVQILARGLPLEALGELLPAVALFALTCRHVRVSWNLGNLLFLGLIVVSGAVIEWAVYLFFAAFDFWTPETSRLWIVNTFLFPTARYPLHIYGRVFASLLTFVFPFGFMAYYPAHHFLQLAPQNFPAYFPFLSPLVAVITLLIALRFWSLGLQHYQSTGT
jgi:ABC-2 type transport system permease protein